jgi:hypothetical protein
MQIEFRECDWFNLWLWMEFEETPTQAERQYLEQVLDAWYTLGMLGGFNAETLVAQDAGVDLSYLDYRPEQDPLPALMHNMGQVDYHRNWGRCWFDLGTADAIALDVLLGALTTLQKEYLSGLLRIVVGGQNEDWPVPETAGEQRDTGNGFFVTPDTSDEDSDEDDEGEDEDY